MLRSAGKAAAKSVRRTVKRVSAREGRDVRSESASMTYSRTPRGSKMADWREGSEREREREERKGKKERR